MRSTRRTATLAVLAITALLAGCSSSDDPATADTTATEAETTAAATTVAEATDTTVVAPDTGAATSADTTPAIVAAADAFLATLSADELAAVQFEFTATEQRQRWSNLPEGLFTRDGLMWENLGDEARSAWLSLMEATLSEEGYSRIMAEWAADDQLAGEGGGGPGGQALLYGQQYYWVAIIGTPSETEPWQWQWGGHHVTVNATIVGTEVALTPSFIGVQPATYTGTDGADVRPLGDIEDAAFALVGSLDDTQAATAVLGSEVIDLVLGPGEDGRTIESEGLAGAEMSEDQRALLLSLIGHYGGLVNTEDAAARMAQLEAELDDTFLAWYGPTTAGSGIYFRVTGPSIVIEYSGQSMGGDASDHVHGIYRDPTNDYGAALGAGI